MFNQKRFGRKISVPSTMEIRRDLVEMARADTLVESVKGCGVSRDEFATMVSALVGDHLLSPSRGQALTHRFERAQPGTASAAGDRVAR